MIRNAVLILFIIFTVMSLGEFVSASNITINETVHWQSSLSAVWFSSTSLGDIDDDGLIDLVLTGCLPDGGNRCENGVAGDVYLNNGSSLNQSLQWQNNITGVGWSSTSLGDVDNDGDLDLALVGCTNASNNGVTCNGDILAKIYISNGSAFNQSAQWQSNLTGTFAGAIVLADINNDGKLDLLQVGRSGSGEKIARVYINNGSTLSETPHWQSNLTGLDDADISVADIDNDGKLDLALTGENSDSTTSTRIYLSNGSSFNFNSQWSKITDYDQSAIIFGDIDNDNDLDSIIIGCCDETEIWENNRTSFVLKEASIVQDPSLAGIFSGSISFGDYDSDGFIDFAGVGRESGRNRVYVNNISREHNFSQDLEAGKDLQGTDQQQGTVVWADLDNDGDLDLIATGLKGATGLLSRVFISNASDAYKNNTKPNPPTINLFSNYSKGVLNLSWENATDAETGSNGLYYNLMAGNETKNHTIVSGVFGGSSGGSGSGGGGTEGYFGNMMQRKNISLNATLNDGNYYWYVQTIDTALAKSNWSSAQNFTVDTANPTTSSIAAGSITTTSAVITWTTNEIANSTVFYGDTIATASNSDNTNYATSHSISLTGLTSGTTYYYNVSSCDGRNNCNVSTQRSFNSDSSGGSSSSSSSGGGGGGGGGGGAGITTITPAPAARLFDVDFSKEESRSIEAKEGDIRTFSFNGITTHKITTLEIGKDFARLLIESEPISIILNIGKSEKIDVNNDKIYDFEIKLVSILSGKAKFSLSKMEGAESVASEEIEAAAKKEALFDVKVSIPDKFKKIFAGKDVLAQIEVSNVNNIGKVDVLVDYFIIDRNEEIITSKSESIAVEAITSFVRSLQIPEGTEVGKYDFAVDVSYKEIIFASGKDDFRVISGNLFRDYFREIIIGILVLAVIVLIAFLIIIWRKVRDIVSHRKLRKSIKVKSGRVIRVH